MDELELELVQTIGTEVCGDCGLNRDCGEELSECFHIINALNALHEWVAI